MHSNANKPKADPAVSRRASLRNLFLPAAALALGGCASAKVASVASSSKPSIELPDRRGASALRPDGTRVFRNHKLYDQDGKPVYFQDDLVEGRVFAATFQYAKCKGICKNMTEKMSAASDILGDVMGNPVRFYIFSLAEDTPAEMKQYMVDRGIYGRPGWKFLTASRDIITDIRWAFGFAEPDEETDQNLGSHTGMVRYCHHPTDKWAACPSLGDPRTIALLMLRVFPNDQRPQVASLKNFLFDTGKPIPNYKPLPPLKAPEQRPIL